MGERKSVQVLVIFAGFVSLIAGASISCYFEEDFCAWHTSTNDKYIWKKSDESTKDRTSGPLKDHTFSNKTDGTIGYYIYSSGWDAGPERNLTALLTSEPVDIQEEAYFTFWYYMNGRNIGNLSLSMLSSSGEKDVIWSAAGSQGNTWKQGSVDIKVSNDNSTFKLQFSSTSPYSPISSDIALDDFLLSTENQKAVTGHTRGDVGTITTAKPTEAILKKGSCNFQVDTCGYVSTGLQGSKLEWLISSGPISSIPVLEGQYAYINTKDINARAGEEASFVSPVLTGGPCLSLSFSYILPFYKPTTLRINLLKENSHISLLNITHKEMRSWKQSENILFNIDTNSKIEFIAQKSGYASYVGLDNIQITKGLSCTSKQNIYCYFDNNTCGFKQTFPVETKHWIWGDSKTGPTIDITTGTGKYMYFNFNKSSTDKTTLLTSPEFDGLSYKCFLIRFNTTSSKPSVLSIFLSTSSQPHAGVPQWTFGTNYTKFGQIEINLPNYTKNRVILEGMITADNDGYFMIDDMSLLTDECKEKPKCTINSCLNHGTCVESINKFICLCRMGYTGERCETSERVSTTATNLTHRTTLRTTVSSITTTDETKVSYRATTGTQVSVRTTSGTPVSARTTSGTLVSSRTSPETWVSSRTSPETWVSSRTTTDQDLSRSPIATSESLFSSSGSTSDIINSPMPSTFNVEMISMFTAMFKDQSVSTSANDLLSTRHSSQPSTSSASQNTEFTSSEILASVTSLPTITTTGRNETKSKSDASLSTGEKTSLIVAGCLLVAIGIVVFVTIRKRKQNNRADLIDDTYEGTRMDVVGKTSTDTPNSVLVINVHNL